MSHERSMYDYCPKCRCDHCKMAKEYHEERAKEEAALAEFIRQDRIAELERELALAKGGFVPDVDDTGHPTDMLGGTPDGNVRRISLAKGGK